MKVRIISAAVAAVLGIVVLFCLPTGAFYFVAALISAVAAFELTRLLPAEPGAGTVRVSSVVTAALVPLCGLIAPWYARPAAAAAVLLLYGFFLVVVQVFCHTLPVKDTAYAFFCTLYVSASFFCLALLRGRENGLFYLIMALIIPWMCDTGAYFSGTFFGKHKMCPEISPKKTWEGTVGGFVFGVALSVGAAYLFWLLAAGQPDRVIGWQVALTAAVIAPVSVIGDLFASVIKRQYQVKDFGNIMPGHGGIMDRFDSVLLSAPMLLALIQVMPLIGAAGA